MVPGPATWYVSSTWGPGSRHHDPWILSVMVSGILGPVTHPPQTSRGLGEDVGTMHSHRRTAWLQPRCVRLVLAP